ncbi:lipase [Nodosilinea sp. LEGE 06152]|uniref:SGNH/GDSL hydrolase family protein n=1 Tax=Nodosilinea sp. LEGE 06152 TaxID=2777966 RepID=UPI001881FD7A|nr:lipase [Nodosilinea sp. LEGE 06152]MBE9158045.1 lipase [Nodosilinea sp. LEGE 06152]
MAKLVAIGDSITQGFQSGAIFRTDLAYPTLIARAMGLRVPSEFPIPSFAGSGLPVNIEDLLRSMEQSLGQEISTWEWVVRLPTLLNQYVDRVEDLYERGAGSRPASYGGCYHNLAVWGFKVIDSMTVSSAYCDQAINRAEGWLEDDFFGLPAAPMYRTAKQVLNPNFQAQKASWTQVHNLKAIVQSDGQLDALILWLGSNDCLGTVVDLNIKDMTAADVQQLEQKGQINDPQARRDWNLTNLNLFQRDFTALVETVAKIILPSTKVFVGTVPHVTIPPITQGLGDFDGKYFEYYGSFFASPYNIGDPPQRRHLTKAEVIAIDQRVDGFNEVIRDVVGRQSQAWTIVETGAMLDALAVKRNNSTDAPGMPLIEYCRRKGRPDHPLLNLEPVPSILRFSTQNATRLQGGLFSLDCIHPTTIGYGLIAEEFLTAMQTAGVAGADPLRLDWPDIIIHDTLLQAPPALWDDILTAAEHNAALWDTLLSFMT